MVPDDTQTLSNRAAVMMTMWSVHAQVTFLCPAHCLSTLTYYITYIHVLTAAAVVSGTPVCLPSGRQMYQHLHTGMQNGGCCLLQVTHR
jgi:hypothetical protein